MKPIPIVINHPKRHPHLLTFFPKQTSLACDVCGHTKEYFPTYVCARCVFVVHQLAMFVALLHFSHGHNLKLETSTVYDEGKFCQVCVFPIYEGNYYSCIDHQCDFILHEVCANAPLMKQHTLHSHPLKLKVDAFICSACGREGDGFVYKCHKDEDAFQLDVRCAFVSEPFEYEGHEHPLFLSLHPEEERMAICQICQENEYNPRKLNCIECDYIICFKCATLPYKARYNHDKHFLTFYEAKKASDHSEWCDVCKRKIADSARKGFYSCDDCCTTLHIDCLFGKEPYVKPGQMVRHFGKDVHISRNNTQSRPFCYRCKQRRCRNKVYFVYKRKK